MSGFVPGEKATTIRMPSTANLMVDSADRNEAVFPSAFNFQIQKNQSILNGFFTRIGTTEVVLEWCQENITTANNTITVDISGTGANTYFDTVSVTVTSGFYTIKDALDFIINALNDLEPTTGATFSVVQDPGNVFIDCSGADATFDNTPLANQLTLDDASTPAFIICPDLRPYRYIDFVSTQLTYSQDLKDSTTSPTERDVLCRWYFSYDDAPSYDAYGFPILMGYSRFCLRRIFNPPKQIKWDNNLPIGNLTFQVYDNNGLLIPSSAEGTEWLMTLQVSEV